MTDDDIRDLTDVEPTPPELLPVKADYEGRELSIDAVARKHGTSRRQLYVWAHRYGWKLRSPRRVDKRSLIQRLLRLIEAQIAQLEDKMEAEQIDQSAVLAKLVATLDRLIDIKQVEASARTARKRESKAITELRAKIAERIAELNQA